MLSSSLRPLATRVRSAKVELVWDPPWTRDRLPVLVTGEEASYDQVIAPGSNPPLLLKDGAGVVRYVVINGQLFDAATASW